MICEKHREPNDLQKKKFIDFDYVKKLGHYSNEPVTTLLLSIYMLGICVVSYNLLFRSTLCLL
jgi:hypothetical protein